MKWFRYRNEEELLAEEIFSSGDRKRRLFWKSLWVLVFLGPIVHLLSYGYFLTAFCVSPFAFLLIVYLFRRFFEDRIILNSEGVGFQSKNWHIVVPWEQLDPSCPASIDSPEEICLYLCSDLPGKSYVVKKGYFNTDDIDGDVAFSYEDAILRLYFKGVVPDTLLSSIKTRRRIHSSKVISVFSKPLKGTFSICLDRTNWTNQIAAVFLKTPCNFPSFCPFFGDICDTVYTFPLLGDAFSMPVSSKSLRKIKRRKIYRYLVVLLVFVFYASLGKFLMDSIYPADFQKDTLALYALVLSPIFLIIPSCWYFWRNPVNVFISEEEGLFFLKIDDRDYFRAFVDLNVGV